MVHGYQKARRDLSIIDYGKLILEARYLMI